jgi:hypothetical protein
MLLIDRLSERAIDRWIDSMQIQLRCSFPLQVLIIARINHSQQLGAGRGTVIGFAHQRPTDVSPTAATKIRGQKSREKRTESNRGRARFFFLADSFSFPPFFSAFCFPFFWAKSESKSFQGCGLEGKKKNEASNSYTLLIPPV